MAAKHFALFIYSLFHVVLVSCAAEDIGLVLYGTVGQSVSIPCDLPISDPADVTWSDFVHNPDRNAILIYTARNGLDSTHPNAVNYAVDEKTFTLTISNISPEKDPGNYICQSTVDGVAHNLTYYLAIAGQPQCAGGEKQLTTGVSVNLTCESVYAGNVAPQLTWVRGTSSEPVTSQDHYELLRASRVVHLTSSPDDDQRTYTCRQKFGVTEEQCSRTLHVLYAVQNVSLYPVQDVYHINDKVACRARGQPIPDVHLHVDRAPPGSQAARDAVVIPAEWVGQEITITCTAKNTVNDEQHEASFTNIIHVTVATEPTTSSTVHVAEGTLAPGVPASGVPDAEPSAGSTSTASNQTGIIIGLIVAGIVVILVIVAFVCMRKRRQNKKKRGAKAVPTSEAQAEMNSKNTSRGQH
jgi:hypothetical protein